MPKVSQLDGPRLLSQQDAAKYLAVSPRTVWQLAHDGHIKKCHVGRQARYLIDSIDSYIERQLVVPEGAK